MAIRGIRRLESKKVATAAEFVPIVPEPNRANGLGLSRALDALDLKRLYKV